jgi:S-(hydroxymethyl)glutathione dehydrogenase/alcohol dehydrogenase
MGLAPVVHLMPELFQKMINKGFDPTDIVTHRVALDDAAAAY